MITEQQIRADERHRALSQADTAHGFKQEAHCPSFAASTAAATSSPSTPTWATPVPLLDRIRTVLTARPTLPQGEALVIFADGHVGRYQHACTDCVGPDAVVIQLAVASLAGEAATGSELASDPSS